jgi:MerR family mercuric resistance operon transcriptional regulator
VEVKEVSKVGLSIGQLAKQADVGVETIRFYERQGLLPPTPLTASGYRKYPERMVERLGFIQRAKTLGFTLSEIGELLELDAESATPGAEVREKAEAKLADIEARIGDLEQMRSALKELTDRCGSDGEIACPILDALSGSEREQRT